MKKKKFISALLLLCQITCYSQTWLSPINFTSSTYLCDQTPKKLVFYDDFNGTQLSSQWIDFVSWSGMVNPVTGVHGDHEDIPNSRISDFDHNFLYSHNNVEVSNGTVKLKLKNEHWNWQCATCGTSGSGDLTGAIIATPYLRSDPNWNVPNFFNQGEFEFRAKFPKAKYTWAAAWLFHGNHVNEIDFIETYGGHTDWPYFGNSFRATTNASSYANPSNPVSYKAEIGTENYPHLSWWEKFTNSPSLYRQEDWHIYNYIWDTTQIKYAIDGNTIRTIYKYSQDKNIRVWFPFPKNKTIKIYPTNCYASGIWNITYGYPWYDKSECNFRIEQKIEWGHSSIPGSTFEIGQTEVDYVKIWQRHPELDNHSNICDSPPPVISGPSDVCQNTTYSVPSNLSGGQWTFDNDGILLINSTANSITVMINPSSLYNNTTITYAYIPNGCPTQYVHKNVSLTGAASPAVMTSRNWHLFKEEFNFWCTSAGPNATYYWDVYYGLNSNNFNHYTASGQYITTPSINHWGIASYNLQWALTITTPCGVRIRYGSKNNASGKPAPPSSEPQDGYTSYHFDADLSKVEDSIAYEKSVDDGLYSLFFSPEDDTSIIQHKYDEIRVEKLEPYIVFGIDSQINNQAKISINSGSTNSISKSTIYPNPTLNNLNIILNEKYDYNSSVQLTIYDLQGRKIKSVVSSGQYITLNLLNLDSGSYIIEIMQKGNQEKHLFTKQ